MTSKTGKMSGGLKTAEVPANVEVATRHTERDAIQVQVDEATKKLHDAWEAAGKPTRAALLETDEDGKGSKAFMSAAKQAYTVGKDDRSALKSIIRRACLLHDGVPVYARDVVSEKDGEVTVTYAYGPPAVKTDAETPATDGQSPDTPAAPDASGDAGDAGGEDGAPTDQENPPDEPTSRRRFGR
jgi:hypothetical protein